MVRAFAGDSTTTSAEPGLTFFGFLTTSASISAAASASAEPFLPLPFAGLISLPFADDFLGSALAGAFFAEGSVAAFTGSGAGLAFAAGALAFAAAGFACFFDFAFFASLLTASSQGTS